MLMTLPDRFQKYIKQENLFQPQHKLLLAVSGGIDSVVLADLCHRSSFAFAIAHCNFQLRGEESTRDENFVRALAERYQVKCFLKKFDTERYAAERKLSIQVAARELRYGWFNEIVKGESGQYDYLLTAHHADDNIETMLMNFFKGTGIAGLRAILPKQDKVVRPLLFCNKEALLAYAAEQHLRFVEDSSNSSDKYSRNYFRNQLIPSIEKVFPAVRENLKDNLKRFQQAEILYDQAVGHHRKNLLEKKGSEIHIPVLKLKKTAPLETVVYELVKLFGFTAHQVTDIIRLLDSDSGKYVASRQYRIIRNRNWLVIAAMAEEASNLQVIEEGTKEQLFSQGRLIFKYAEVAVNALSADPNTACINETALRYPLLLRKWKQGDYFYPLGMKKKKKLSRFFIDQKLSITEKEKTWVLEANKKIVWVIGRRIDDRFKIMPSSKRMLVINFIPIG